MTAAAVKPSGFREFAMPQRAEQQKLELIEQVAGSVADRLPRPKAAAAEQFARLFYRDVAPGDILEQSADDLYGAAVSLFHFAGRRRPGTAKIRAYNPRYDEHGWHSRHTIVEIVNDDMPFLVGSVTAALNRLGLTVHLVIHPVVRVERDAEGGLIALYDRAAAPAGTSAESVMHVEVDAQGSDEALARIETCLAAALTDVRHAVEDWRAICGRMNDLVEALDRAPPPAPPSADTIPEVIAFLRWLVEDHYIFLGYREYRFTDTDGRADLVVVPDSGLGLLRDDDVLVFEGLRRNLGALPPEVQDFVRQPWPLMVTKANRRSTVHRPVHLDTVIVKIIDRDGRVIGERIFVGLFTSSAYTAEAEDIPYLRQKVRRVLARAGFEPSGHSGKALAHVLNTFPRDELYQIGDEELLDTALGILHLQERQRTALFVRKDPFERFMSCLVFVPRDRYNTQLRMRIQGILEKAFCGRTAAFYTQMAEGVNARLHFIIKTAPGQIPACDTADIEARMVAAGREWSDRLKDALIDARGEERGLALFRAYGQAFQAGYRERTIPPAAIFDIEWIERVLATGVIGINLYRRIEATEREIGLKVYHQAAPLPLSDVLPVLEHMGLRVVAEFPSQVAPADREEPVWIHDFACESHDGSAIQHDRVHLRFEDALAQVWAGALESDGFNRLVLSAELGWREVAVLRAYAKYLRQARFSFSQDYLEAALGAHPQIARLIFDLFAANFDPAQEHDRMTRVAGIRDEIDTALDGVANLDEDRILRRFVNLVRATLRTNFYQSGADGAPKPYLSFKFDSQAIEGLPLPRPWREIFVYSPRVEGVHLRGGKVARGGIRWSDRREDFRTEVLGLMKAQRVKNAVIVPVGSKGGFVVKRPPKTGGREALLAEGIECYKTLMRGMLDLTDNRVDGQIAPPAGVVRHDQDDPYLVVAADKGTATFSDIANGVARAYGFWLDDAFASGGSAGYDHKKMGITARGAWESVRRHFRELDVDIQNQDFDVVGVGDMSGDVFGNGMLLSRHIRLIGAFNHLHIFIDPDPDPAPSFAERTRLFELARGSWDQYDPALISEGGGVFERSAKAIRLSPQIRERFGIDRTSVTPAELISALLRSQTDLLWFGGIGTYLKAGHESHAEAGDKANDAVRIDAARLRARVIGEGANLAMTQFARIEAARAGIRLNTDFIDNSGGVDCSDHEVNIKIALDSVVTAGDLTLKQRNALLERMTGEVADLVLRDNYLQSQALTLALAEGPGLLDQQARFMRALEKAGKLDRAVEMLPDEEAVTERLARREGLTRPEQAVLLCYGKITLYDTLLAGDLPDDPGLEPELHNHFPAPLREGFPAAVGLHPLRREIVATHVTNSMVNRVGPTFVAEMTDKTGMGARDVARAYLIVRDSFGLRDLWSAIEALDTRVEAAVQTRMMLDTRRLIERVTAWLLRLYPDDLDIARQVAHFRPGIEPMLAEPEALIHDDARTELAERAATLAAAGVPAELAGRVAALPVIAAGFDLVHIAGQCRVAVRAAGPVYFELGRRLGLAWLRDGAQRMPAASHWQQQAVAAIVDDLFTLQTDLTVKVLDGKVPETGAGVPPNAAIDAWLARRRQPVDRIDQLLSELRALPSLDLSMLAVANRRLRGLAAG